MHLFVSLKKIKIGFVSNFIVNFKERASILYPQV